MLEIRLKRRLQEPEYLVLLAEYCDYVFAGRWPESELVHLIDVVTTNKTDFFREAGHFEYLVSQSAAGPGGAHTAWPEIAGLERRLLHRRRALHAGHGAERVRAGPLRAFGFSVLATDICTAVLDKARLGIFKSELVDPVPRGTAPKVLHAQPRARIGPGARRSRTARAGRVPPPELHGRRLRPRGAAGNHLLPQRHHLFRPADAGSDSSESSMRQLVPGGYFFAGHSESLQGMDLPLVPGGAVRLQEGAMSDDAVPICPNVNLQPGEVYLARKPGDSANHSGIVRGRHVLERAPGRRRVVPRRPAPLPAGDARHRALRTAIAMSTSAFATWRRSSMRSASRRENWK